MVIKDVDILPTTSFQKVSSLTIADTDHDSNDVSTVWYGVTISNLTDKEVYIKSTSKGLTPTGQGRLLNIGESIFYATFDSKRCWIKASGVIGTGKVVLSGEQE